MHAVLNVATTLTRPVYVKFKLLLKALTLLPLPISVCCPGCTEVKVKSVKFRVSAVNNL